MQLPVFSFVINFADNMLRQYFSFHIMSTVEGELPYIQDDLCELIL